MGLKSEFYFASAATFPTSKRPCYHVFFWRTTLWEPPRQKLVYDTILRDRTACYLYLVTNHYGTDQLKYCNKTYTSGVWRKAPRKTNTPNSRLSHPNIIPYQRSASSLTHIKKGSNCSLQFANVAISNFLMGGAARPNIVHAFDFLLITNNPLPHPSLNPFPWTGLCNVTFL